MHKVTKIMVRTLCINLLLSILQFMSGIVGHSSAIIADGVHTLSDFSTDLIAIVGEVFSHQKANRKHPYGYGQIEYLTSILIGIFVLVIGLFLIAETMEQKLLVPNIIVAFVVALTIIAKFVLSSYLLEMGHKYDNAILIANGKESHAAVISSMFVLISSLLAQLSKYNQIFIYADRLAALLVGMFIVKVGFDIMAENMSDVIGEQELDNELQNKLHELILNHDYVKAIHKLVLLKYGPYYQLVGEIEMDGGLSLDESEKNLALLEKEIHHSNQRFKYITIQVSPSNKKITHV